MARLPITVAAFGEHVPVGQCIRQAAAQDWFILFGDGDRQSRAWWQRFLAPGYRHVIAVRELVPGVTLVIEHSGTRMAAEIVYLSTDELVLDYLRQHLVQHAIKVRVPVPDDMLPRARLRLAMTCVEVTKALLGITALAVFTPAQLARRLRANGAWEVPPLSITPAA